jgi:uncharacterized protein (TIGR02284 family)
MSKVDHDISVLNSLIKTTLDSRKGFRDAAEDATSPRFQQMFRQFAEERGQVASRLQTEVRQLGGTPEDDSSFLAAAHRAFMDLKNVVTGNDDRAVINEVERGEDYIKGKFEMALRDDELSPSTRAVISEAFASVRAGHDRASQLKHGMAS